MVVRAKLTAAQQIQKWMFGVYNSAVKAGLPADIRPIAFTINSLVERMGENGINISKATVRTAIDRMIADGVMMDVATIPRSGKGGRPEKMYSLAEVLDLETTGNVVPQTQSQPTKSAEDIDAQAAKLAQAETVSNQAASIKTSNSDGDSVAGHDHISDVAVIVVLDDNSNDALDNHSPVIEVPRQMSRSERRAGAKKAATQKQPTQKQQPNRVTRQVSYATAIAAMGPDNNPKITEQMRNEAINGFAKAFSEFAAAVEEWGPKQDIVMDALTQFVATNVNEDANFDRLGKLHDSMADKIDAIGVGIIRILDDLTKLNDVGVNFKFPNGGVEIATIKDVTDAYERGFQQGWKLRGELPNG